MNHDKMYSEEEILNKIQKIKISDLKLLYERLFEDPNIVTSIIGPEKKDFSGLTL